MVWYADGSIQVTANGQVATGNGTAFLKNVRIGDGITITGSTAQHEVTSVTSDTQLTFAPAYAGAAGSGKAYRVAPMLGYDKDLSDAFNEIRLELGDFANNPTLRSLAALQGSAGQALRFKSAGELEAFLLGTAAARDVTTSATDITAGRLLKAGDGGWMGDVPVTAITSIDDKTMRGWRYITGPSIPGVRPSGLTYGHLFTAGNTNDAVFQLLYNITGAVSTTYTYYYRQAFASGAWGAWREVLTDVSIESSENANGVYTRFPDGTMLVNIARKVIRTVSENTNYHVTIDLPSTFINIKYAAAVTIGPVSNTNGYVVNRLSTAFRSTSQLEIILNASVVQDYYLDINIQGRWK